MAQQSFDRVYHHYLLWEENSHNMWGSVNNKKKFLQKAVEFTGNHRLYGRFMLRVSKEWKYSCENALTDSNLNKRAWIGHAACALALDCPESIVREAWGMLSDEQRILANKRADEAIRSWEISYAKDKCLRVDVGESMLF